MGLFSSKKTYVSSSVYNMAGDIAKRPNYLKTLITSHVITDNGSRSFGSSIRDGYLRGPGLQLRHFGTWARDHYPAVGVAKANLYSQPEIPAELVSPLVPKDQNEIVNIQRIETKQADYAYWAEQWMLEHYPEQIDTEWVSNFDEATNDIKIVLADGVTASFTPSNFDPKKFYVYALYNLIRGQELGPVVAGVLKTGTYPSTTGWTSTSNVASNDTKVLTKVVKKTVSYSDGRPDEVTVQNTTSTSSYTYYRAVFEKTDYKGSKGETAGADQFYSVKSKLYLFRDGVVDQTTSVDEIKEELDDGKLIRRTKTETTQEILVVNQTYRTDTQEVTRQTFSKPRLLIYRVGTGGSPAALALDAKFGSANQDGFYLPFIPVRLDNKMVDNANYPVVRPQNEKAYKKLTGQDKYSEQVVDPVAGHKDLKEMDYVYVMLGVSLNTRENSAKKYLFSFLERLLLTQQYGSGAYNAWQTKQDVFDETSGEWVEWRSDQNDATAADFGSLMPSLGSAYMAPSNEVRIRGSGALATNMDMSITWNSIASETGSGLKKPGAKKGDTWIEYVGSSKYANGGILQAVFGDNDKLTIDTVRLHQQVTANSWKTLTVVGLKHRNYIYKGKYVEITAREALQDDEESGFIFPLHYETLRDMPLVDSTQLSTACVYMVINSYKVVKKKWYQTGIFKIFLVIAIVAISVATGGAGAVSAGILGTSASVGAALGLTGLVGVIVGAIANAIAAMILTKLLMIGAVAVFGDKLGMLIATIASVVALQVGTSLSTGSSLASSFGALMRADNITNLTSAVGNGTAGYIQAGAQQTMNKTDQMMKDYRREQAEITRLFEQNIGFDRARLDPMLLLSDGGLASAEDAETFLQRTLMTGTDVAELSLSMLSNFSEITLSTSLKL